MIDHGIIRVVKHDPNDPLQDTLEVTEKGLDEKEYQKYIKEVYKKRRDVNQ